MTDDDDTIELPLLPRANEPMHTGGQMFDYARAAVLADRERRAKVGAKPVVHVARLSLADNGDWSVGGVHRPGRINILIRWTDDGRVWIESEQNRALARSLRRMYHDNAILAAADALDGGER